MSKPEDKVVLTIEEQLKEAQKEIASLKEKILFWKDAWYEARENIGKVSWQMPNIPFMRNYSSIKEFEKELFLFDKYAKASNEKTEI